jgi:hypothetical protein
MGLQVTYPNHVWSYDFAQIRDAYGGKIGMLTLIDELSSKCLTINCARRIGSIQVTEQLANTIITHTILKHTRADNGTELIAKDLRKCISGIGKKTAYIEPGCLRENGFCENLGTFGDNLLDGKMRIDYGEPRWS